MRHILFALILFGDCIGVADATTWYVNSMGCGGGTACADTNDGKTPGTAFLTLNKAVSVTVPGDTVACTGFFGGGTGGSDPFTINVPGTAGNPITYTSLYQGMSGPPCVVNSTQSFNAVHVTPSATANIAYITIQYLEVAGHNGDVTLATAWTNASASTWGNSGLYNGGGIVIDNGTAPTNQTSTGTSASGQAVITTSTNPTTGGVLAGDSVYDSTTPTNTPSGCCIVASRTTSSITLTTNLPNAIVTGHTLKVVHVPHHITVQYNKVHDFPENGIQCSYGDYLNVNYNWVWNNAWYSPYAGAGISCAFLRDVDTTTGYKTNVTGNVAWGNINLVANHFNSVTGTANATTASGNPTLHFASTPAVTDGMQIYDTQSGNSGAIVAGTTILSHTSTTITMSNNATGSGVGGTDTFLFAGVTDGEGIIIDDTQGDQQGFNAYVGAVLVQNNLHVNNGAGLTVFDSNNVDVLNNTMYLNQRNNLFTQSEINNTGAINGHIGNNILVASGSKPILVNQATSGATLDHNLGSGGNGTTMAGTSNVSADPLFVAPTTTMPLAMIPIALTNFQLQPGSPAIDAGNAAYTRTTDILGNPAPVGPSVGGVADIGAYESPCSPYGAGNSLYTSMNSVMTAMAGGQQYGISPGVMRNIILTAWCGRSPYPR